MPLKMARARWFDGTALCIGSMTPDLAYSFNGWIDEQSHKILGIIVWGIPVALLATWTIRRWVASVAFAQLPDFGPFRLHSLRALGRRSPAWFVTAVSASLGVSSHVGLDAFTHADRPGARWLGLNRIFLSHGQRSMNGAQALQYIGHTAGSLCGLMLLLSLGRSRSMERWYGAEAVATCRSFHLRLTQRVIFWAFVATGPLAGIWIGRLIDDPPIAPTIDSLAVLVVLASALPICRPTEVAPAP